MILVYRQGLRSILWVVVVLLPVMVSAAYAGDGPKGYHEELACHVGPYRLHLPKSLSALRVIGKLKSDRILEVEDLGENGKVEVRKLAFDGLEMIIEISPDGTAYDVAAVTITSPKWKIANGFRVGDRIEKVVKQLGGKGEKKGKWLEVDGDSHSIHFRIFKGRVVEIKYACSSP